MFWKKEKTKSANDLETLEHELEDLNFASINAPASVEIKPEVEQYLDYDAKISAQTKAYLQNQQTKILEFDDLETLLEEHKTTNFAAIQTPAEEPSQNYQTQINQEQEQLKKDFIDPLLVKPTQNQIFQEATPVAEPIVWDFEKLVPISEPRINLRVAKTEKRSLI